MKDIPGEESSAPVEPSDSQILTDAILNQKTTTESKEEGTTETFAPKTEPESEEKNEEKPAPTTEEVAKISEVLKTRFKGSPEEVTKAYVNLEKKLSEQGMELGNLRSEILQWRQFQEDFATDPQGTLAKLQASISPSEEKENILMKALDDPKLLDQYIDQKISEREAGLRWETDYQKRMVELYPGWEERKTQREALRQAIVLGKFPYPDEILDFAVRGAGSPEKLLEDAKKAIREEEEKALVAKTQEGMQTQVGAGEEKKELTDEQIMTQAILNATR